MKLMCLLSLHNWEIKEEIIKLPMISESQIRINLFFQIKSFREIYTQSDLTSISTKSRVCKTCFRKQIVRPDNGNWLDWNLNKVELRESKLNKLGI